MAKRGLSGSKAVYLQYLGMIHAANYVQSRALTSELEARIRAKGLGAVLDYFSQTANTEEISNLMNEGLANIVQQLVHEDPKGVSAGKYHGLVLTAEGTNRLATFECGPEIFDIMPKFSANQILWLRNILRIERDPAYV